MNGELFSNKEKEGEGYKLMQALSRLTVINDGGELQDLACKVDQGIRDAEFNFPAEIILYLDVQSETGKDRSEGIRKSAEESMMQMAFFNLGLQPPCSFIMACYQEGWRYRIDKGFHKLKEQL